MSGVSGIVLAGGESRRLGSEKALHSLLGRPLLAHVISRIRPLVDDVLLVTGPMPRYEQFGERVITDVVGIRGSLAGIYSGLLASTHPLALVVACDMPFLNQELLRYMIELAPGWDVVMPRLRTGLEPLHSIYSVSCVAPIRGRLNDGERKIISFLEGVRVRYVGDDEVDRYDPDRLSFFNLNTPDDAVRMEQIATRQSLGNQT